jgi:hypothetical protein
MVIIVTDVLESTQVDESVLVAAHLHGEELVELHDEGKETALPPVFL